MKKQLKNSLMLCLTTAAVALGGVSVMAAEETGQTGVARSAGFGVNKEFKRTFKFENGEKIILDGDDEGSGIRVKMQMRVMDFSDAVAEGIISQETADKITAYMEQQTENVQAELEKIKNMTSDERNEFYGEGIVKMERKDMFEELINAGIITEAEADALKASMPAKPETAMEFGVRFAGMNTDTLVEKGIIDSATAAKMEAFIEKKAEEMKAEMETKKEEMQAMHEKMQAQIEVLNNMTPEERKEFFESNKPAEMKKHIDILSEMVNDGIITQEQADAIRALTPQTRQSMPEDNAE